VAPEGLTFEKPIANLGPSGRPKNETEYTFDPHCSPSGVLWYRKGTLPAKYDNSFFVARFGNYLGKVPVGFDLMHVKLTEKDGSLEGSSLPSSRSCAARSICVSRKGRSTFSSTSATTTSGRAGCSNSAASSTQAILHR